MSLATALTRLLGIAHPVVQSGMGSVAGPDLVAEVSNAGGLGVLAGLGLPPEELRRRIRRVRELTARPFGVNLWLHAELRPPVDPATLPPGTVDAVNAELNRARRELGLAERHGPPPRTADVIEGALEVILDERPAVFSAALGTPGAELCRALAAREIRVMAMVATVADARRAVEDGADIVIAQGAEAGGHRSTGTRTATAEAASVGTLVLVPAVVDAVPVPVVAAGGVADGRGLAAVLALGGAGVLLGTRFVATRESEAPEFWKKRLLEAEGEATVTTQAFSGLWARGLANRFTEHYRASGAPVLPGLLQRSATGDIVAEAARRQDPDWFPLWAGHSVGLVHDLPGAADVVRALVEDAEAALARLTRPPART